MSDSGYRDWMDALAVGDDLFAQAYSGLSGGLRAWIKQTAAQAHALAGAPLDDCVDIRVGRRQGYRTLQTQCPLDYAVMFIDSTCVSAPRVAAAAVPLVLSGARNVCAVRIDEGEPFADSVLAALELCGLETVFHMHEHDARRFTECLANSGSAAVLFFGQGLEISALATAAGYAAPPLKLWKPLPAERLGVWAGAGGRVGLGGPVLGAPVHLLRRLGGCAPRGWNCPCAARACAADSRPCSRAATRRSTCPKTAWLTPRAMRPWSWPRARRAAGSGPICPRPFSGRKHWQSADGTGKKYR